MTDPASDAAQAARPRRKPGQKPGSPPSRNALQECLAGQDGCGHARRVVDRLDSRAS